MPLGATVRRTRLIGASAATAFLMAGCTTMPSAPCTEPTSYPLPGTLCSATAASSVPTSYSSGSDGGAATPPADVETTSSTGQRKRASPAGTGGRIGTAEVLRRLISTNPDVGIAAAREKEQYAAVKGARAGFLPTVDLTSGIGPQRQWETVPVGNAVRREAGLSVRQVLYDFGVADANFSRTSLSYDSATSSRIAKTEQTAYDMLDLLMKVQQIDENIALARRNIATHERILGLVASSETAGNGTVADTKRVTTRLESAKTSLIDLVTDRTNAADAFRRLTDLDVDIVADTVTRRLVGRPASLDDTSLDLNPEIRALKSEIAALREQLRGVAAGYMPNVGVEGNWRYGRQVSEPDFNTDRRMYGNVLLSVRMPLYDGGLSTSAQEQVQARIQGAELRLDKRRRELREEAQGAQRITASDRDKTGTLTSRVAAARKVQDLYLEQFRDGSRTIFELLDAQVDLVKAENDLIVQTYSRRRSQIRALLLKGALVSAVLRADGR